MTERRDRQAGFTLIELMISLVIFSFVIAGVLAVAVSMTQGFRDQRAALAVESAVRAPLDFIADAVRQASPGSATNNIQDGTTCAAASALTITNNYGGAGWDQLDVIYATGGVVTSSQSIYDGSSNTFKVTDASQLAVGDSIVISNLTQGHLFKITAIATNTLTLGSPCSGISLPSGGYPVGSIVIRAQHAIFFIGTVDGIPTLMMNATGNPATNSTAAEPLAEGIEDLQVAAGIDTASDGVSEVGVTAGDDEWQGNVAGDAAITGTLRAIRISMVARETSQQGGTTSQYLRPALEDHAASSTYDKYPRRVLKSTVEIRSATPQ